MQGNALKVTISHVIQLSTISEGFVAVGSEGGNAGGLMEMKKFMWVCPTPGAMNRGPSIMNFHTQHRYSVVTLSPSLRSG